MTKLTYLSDVINAKQKSDLAFNAKYDAIEKKAEAAMIERQRIQKLLAANPHIGVLNKKGVWHYYAHVGAGRVYVEAKTVEELI
jgi:hypothetical protein